MQEKIGVLFLSRASKMVGVAGFEPATPTMST